MRHWLLMIIHTILKMVILLNKMATERAPLVWVLWVLKQSRVLKVWVLAPMVFSDFSQISINFYENDKENVTNPVISWEKAPIV